MAPLPTVLAVCRVDFEWSDGISTFGSRNFVATGDPDPGVDSLNTLASGMSDAMGGSIMPLVSSGFTLIGVTATDLSSDSGNEGHWGGSVAGGDSEPALPSNVAIDLRLRIAPRYRGGHPVMHLPPSSADHLSSRRQWSAAFVTSMNDAGADYLAAVNDITAEGFTGVNWIVLRGYRPGALPEAVTQDPVLSTDTRQYVGTMRRRARSLR